MFNSGVAAGSAAAAIQSSIGAVAAGSAFAAAQSGYQSSNLLLKFIEKNLYFSILPTILYF